MGVRSVCLPRPTHQAAAAEVVKPRTEAEQAMLDAAEGAARAVLLAGGTPNEAASAAAFARLTSSKLFEKVEGKEVEGYDEQVRKRAAKPHQRKASTGTPSTPSGDLLWRPIPAAECSTLWPSVPCHAKTIDCSRASRIGVWLVVGAVR